jgi:hypothetical protein
MSKTGRKWLKTTWADPDCCSRPGYPLFSATESVKDRLDNIYQKSETYSKSEVDTLVENMGNAVTLLNPTFSLMAIFLSGSAEQAAQSISTSRTFLADRWSLQTGAGTLASVARSARVPSTSRSRYSMQLTGRFRSNSSLYRTRIEAMNTPRSTVYFSIYIYNGSGAAFSPVLQIRTPSASDTWSSITTVASATLQECSDSAWTKVSWSGDLSGYSNIENGVEFRLVIPSGSLVAGDTVYLADATLSYGSSYTAPIIKTYAQEYMDCLRYFRQATDRGRRVCRLRTLLRNIRQLCHSSGLLSCPDASGSDDYANRYMECQLLQSADNRIRPDNNDFHSWRRFDVVRSYIVQ